MVDARIPLRYILRPREVVGRQHLSVLSVYRDYGVVHKDSRTDNFNRTPPDLSKYQEVRPGDLVINKMKAWQGSLGISPHSGIVSPDYLVCGVSSFVQSRYLHYLLRSSPLVSEYYRRSKGIRPAQWRLYWDDLAGISVVLPSVDEQRCIADFLDHESTRIDTLVIARTRQDELLAERFQDMVSSIADSLLARWRGSRLRFLLHSLEQGWSPECEDRLAAEDEWGVVKAGCVNGGVFRPDQHKALPPNVPVRREYQLRPGDLLMCRASGSTDLIGSAGVVSAMDRRLLLCDKVYRLRLDEKRVNVMFAAHMLRTQAVREQIKLGISGATGLANNLPSSVVKDLAIPIPPLDIQLQIVDTIQNASVKVSNLRYLLNIQLALLAERRKALITAAVTGQMDVTTARGGSS